MIIAFFSKKICHVKKNEYFCTRFQEIKIDALVAEW